MGRIFRDYKTQIHKAKITATFSKNTTTTLTGWYNEYHHIGYVYCENPNDKDKVMTILKNCGYNACASRGDKTIEVMYNTRQDDWGIKV